MKYQNHEVEIIRWVGRNVEIKRVDGGKLKTVSGLRHHFGTQAIEVDSLTTSPQNIEGFTGTEPTFHDKVEHYVDVMTSKTAEFEYPE